MNLRFTVGALISLGLFGLSAYANSDAHYNCWLTNDLKQTIALMPTRSLKEGILQFSGVDNLSGIQSSVFVNPNRPDDFFTLSEVDILSNKNLIDPREYSNWANLENSQSYLKFDGYSGEYFCGYGDTPGDLINLKPSRRAPILVEGNKVDFYQARAEYFREKNLIDFYFTSTPEERDQVTINTPSAIIVTHPNQEFDDGKSKKDFEIFLNSIKKMNVPVVGLIRELAFPDLSSNIRKEHFDFIGHSYTGAHGLVFPSAKTIVLAGGYLEQCLCESIQGVFRNLVSNQNITVVIPLNLVYFSNWKPVMDIFLPSQPVSHFEKSITLQDLKKLASSETDFNEKLMQALRSLVFGEEDVEGAASQATFCPFQSDGNLSISKFEITVFLQDSKSHIGPVKIGSLGNGERKVKILFADEASVQKQLISTVGPITGRLSSAIRGNDLLIKSRKFSRE